MRHILVLTNLNDLLQFVTTLVTPQQLHSSEHHLLHIAGA